MPDRPHPTNPGPGLPSGDAPLADGEAEDSTEAVVAPEMAGPSRSDSPGQRLLENLLDIQDHERKRLGQELHDAAGELLTSLQFSIARLRGAMDKSEQASIVDEISDIVGRVDREIRSLAFLNYPAELGCKGVCGAVQTLALGFGRRTGIDTKFKCVGSGAAANEEESLALLRVAQEALTNVYRHSHASEARVVLQEKPKHLLLTVVDNGIGIGVEAASQRAGLGISSMRGRVEVLGGRLTVRKLKVGTSVSATVPLRARQPESSAA